MTQFLNYIIESSVLILILGSTYFILMQNDKQFNFRRFFIVGGLLFSLIAPLIHVDLSNPIAVLAAIDTKSFLPSVLPELVVTEDQLANSGAAIGIQTIMLLVYVSISVLLIIRLSIQFYKIKLLYISNPSTKDSSGKSIIVKVKESNCAFNFMHLIFISANPLLNDAENEKILNHERVHARHFHTMDNLFLQLIGIFFWFHPLIWLLKKELGNVHEYIADREVVREGVEEEYISLISKITLQANGMYLANHFSKSSTLNRINMLTSKNLKISKTKSIVSICVIFTFGLLFSCNDQIASATEAEIESSIPEYDTDEIFAIPEVSATPKTSERELYASLAAKIKYPEEAIKMGIEGKVFIEFIVEKDGSLSNRRIVKGISPDCDNEALRVTSEMEDWVPGTHKGVAVRQKMVLPISFKLTD